MPADIDSMRTQALEALLLEYRKAVHDMSNVLAAASMRLEIYGAAARDAGQAQSAEAAELATAMREAIAACCQVIERLYAARDVVAGQ